MLGVISLNKGVHIATMGKMSRLVCLSILLILFHGCAGVKVIRGSRNDLYRSKFLRHITKIKKRYHQGYLESSLRMLKAINAKTLWKTERTMRRNLMGEILFSKGQYEKAIYHFNLALNNSSKDEALTAKIYLNLGRSYFKMGLTEKSLNNLKLSNHQVLLIKDAKIHHQLMYRLSQNLDQEEQAMISLGYYLRDKKRIDDLKSDPYFGYLMSNFAKLSKSEKWNFLERFEEENLLSIAYLAYLEMEKLYYKGKKSDAMSILDWIDGRFDHEEILDLIKNSYYRIENYAQMDPNAIGVLLPLSGKQRRFGHRALLGIDNGLRKLRKYSRNFRIFVKDSKGSGAVGAFQTQQLIKKHHVSAVIGGLFSSEAIKEYLEAVKHGVFFISLSPIYLPKQQKNHLLLEIPGSVESQLHKLFTSKVLETFGRRVAIIHPKGDRGNAYLNEFWRLAGEEDVEITGIHSYDKKKTDHRGPVQNLLGLKFTRSRQEELDILADVYSLEHQAVRRIQTLRPQIDFDWVFLPAIPKEALQIIPSFSYFDAFNLKFVGVPSWRSKSFSQQGHRLGQLFFIGDNLLSRKSKFAKKFFSRYRRRPKIIEMRAYDGFSVMSDILTNTRISSREDLNRHIKNKSSLKGITGKWKLKDGIWIKEMIPLTIVRGKVQGLSIREKGS